MDCHTRITFHREGVRFALGISLSLVALDAIAQTVPVLPNRVAGQRIDDRTVFGTGRDRRVNKRVNTRLQTRLRTRIDQNYDSAGNAFKPFEVPPTDGSRANPQL